MFMKTVTTLARVMPVAKPGIRHHPGVFSRLSGISRARPFGAVAGGGPGEWETADP
jgi:hypothetical protein